MLTPPPKTGGPYYWQRINAATALHLDGPKAQQLLNTDIRGCVTELDELKRLGAINYIAPDDSMPEARPSDKKNFHGKGIYHADTSAEAAEMEDQKRKALDENNIRAVHMPYRDLEGCMAYKGWELVDHAPYEADEDQADYSQKIINQQYQTRMLQRPPATR
jgi:hypothetical protein